jgi:hypothetical protein
MPPRTEAARDAKRRRDREAATRRRADPGARAAELARRRAATEAAQQAAWEQNVAERSNPGPTEGTTMPAAAKQRVKTAHSPLALLEEAATLRAQAWLPATLRRYIGSERWLERNITTPGPQDQLRLYVAFRILVVGSLVLSKKLHTETSRPVAAIVKLMGVAEPAPAAVVEDQGAARDLRDELVELLNRDADRLRGQLQSEWTVYQLDHGRWVELLLPRPEPIDVQSLTASLRICMTIAERMRAYNATGPGASKIAIMALVDRLRQEYVDSEEADAAPASAP